MKLEPVVMVGKDAVTPAVVQSARDVIRKRELIKVRVLNNCLEDASDVMELLAERCDANLVQVKGNTGLLFKRNALAAPATPREPHKAAPPLAAEREDEEEIVEDEHVE